jgi:PPM family protein phosphatase
MVFRSCSATDVGRRRSINQDAVLVDPDNQVFVVADGMGGHEAGDVAAHLIVEAIRQFVLETALDDDKTWPFDVDPRLSYPANRLKTAILVANRRISDQLAESNVQSMGATLAAAIFGTDRAVVANVGDCRAYLMREGSLHQLTRDHSWVADQVESGFITAETARSHPWRHMVTRAVQGEADLLVDTVEFEIGPAGRLLLCSDGLHVVLSDDDITRALNATADRLDSVCEGLIALANERGAPDNVSAVVVEWAP